MMTLNIGMTTMLILMLIPRGGSFFSSVGLLTIFMNEIIRNIYHFLCILGYILIL